MSPQFDPYKAPQASLDDLAGAEAAAPVPPSIIETMSQTRTWVRLVAVLFFIGIFLGGVAAVLMASFGPMAGSVARASMLFPMLLVAGLYLPPAVFLWQYASRIRRLKEGGGMAALEDALVRQKSFWKYVGILALVLIVLYGVALVGLIMFGAALRH